MRWGSSRKVAYQPYVARIGRRPAPMTADYTAITSAGHAWVGRTLRPPRRAARARARRRGYRETHRCIHAGYCRVFFTKSLITPGSQDSASIPDP